MSLNIYLIRHGIAAERGTYADDDQRPLTDSGQVKTKNVAKQLRALNLQWDLILSSPLVRAYQTAELLLAEGLATEMQVAEYLAPAGHIQAWIAWLQTWPPKPDQAIALVGHEPDLGHWAEALIWGASKGQLIVKKAGIIGIRLHDRMAPLGTGELFWLTAPKFLLN